MSSKTLEVSFDSEIEALYVTLSEGHLSRTEAFDGTHLVDLSDDGQLLGIEILDVENLRIEEILEEYDLDHLSAGVEEAIQDAIDS